MIETGFQSRCAKHGVSHEDCEGMLRSGLTMSMVEAAEARGLSFLDLWALVQKYGPLALTIIQQLIDQFNHPPAPVPVPVPSGTPPLSFKELVEKELASKAGPELAKIDAAKADAAKSFGVKSALKAEPEEVDNPVKPLKDVKPEAYHKK